MKGKETAIEVKVGALVLLAIAVFALFVVIIGGVSLPGQSSRIYVDYDSASGLKAGAPVKLAGIKIGSIKAVNYEGGEYDETLGRPVYVRATAQIDSSQLGMIHRDATFGIQPEGMLGEPYIEISSPESSALPLQDGDIVRGHDPPSLSKLLDSVAGAMDGVNQIIDRLNEVEGSGTPIKIDEFINNIGSLAGSLDERIVENADHIDSIFDDVAGILDENRESLKSTIENVDGLTAEFKQVGKSVNHALGRGQSLKNIVDNLDTTLESVSREIDPIMKDARGTLESANKILSDNREGINRTVDNLADVSDDVKNITNRIEDGEGSIGKLLQDEEIFEDLREFIRELKRRPWRIIWKE